MSNLKGRVAAMVHAFRDHERKDAVRALARDVGAMEARVAELEARCKRLEEAGDEMRYAGVFTPKWDGTDTTHVVDAWEKAKEAKP